MIGGVEKATSLNTALSDAKVITTSEPVHLNVCWCQDRDLNTGPDVQSIMMAKNSTEFLPVILRSCLRTWRCSQILVPAEDQAPECFWVCADGHPRESRPQAFSRGQILKLGWSSQGFDSFSASLEGFSA